MSEQTLPRVGGLIFGPRSARGDYRAVVQWLVVTAALALAVAVLWQGGLVQSVLATDHTYMSVLIVVVFALATLHCLVQCLAISKEQVSARETTQLFADHSGAEIKVEDGTVRLGGRALPHGILSRHIGYLARKAQLQGPGAVDQGTLLRDLADELQKRERPGLFVSEALLRLALLGTAIGFILMLIPISGITGFEADVLREALSGMSAGMAIALNVTVLGIACALILKLQYFLLDAETASLYSSVVKVTEIEVLPRLHRSIHAAG